jgi:hypothetical protein
MIARPTTPVGSRAGLAIALARAWWPQVAALAAACGVVATMITGSLAVGSSLERGLRALAFERLGRIEAAVLGELFFTANVVDRLTSEASDGGPQQIVPAVILPVTISTGRGETVAATLLACDDPAALGHEPPSPPLTPDAVLVNPPLAETLGIAAGDAVILRLPKRSTVPADSPLGRRTGESDGRRLSVAAILPDRGLGRFSLRAEQSTQPLVVTSLATARRILRREDAANAILVAGMPPGRDAADWLRSHLAPSLADYGLAFEPASDGTTSLRLTTDRLILASEADAAAAAILGPLGGHPTLVMLANTLATDGPESARASVPYSTVLGIDTTSLPVGDLMNDDGSLLLLPPDDGIIINRWLADDFAAQGRPETVGDHVTLAYFKPETVHGRVVEETERLRITGIAVMESAATSRDAVPEVDGITDEDSIADWDPPFPFDATRVRSTPPHDEDDRYWKQYRTTPKAFVSLATARRLAGSRFGNTTAWLVPAAHISDPATVEAALAGRIRPETMGLRVAPLLTDAIEASRGSTPFGTLFLALSSFVIAAGLLLEWLLFALLVAARRRDLGILAAVGFAPRTLARLLVVIGGIAALSGVAAGTVLGPVWARGLLVLLGRRWAADVDSGSAAAFSVEPPGIAALATAAVAAMTVSLVAIAWAARRAGGVPPLDLIRNTDRPLERRRSRRNWPAAAVAAGGLLAAAIAASQGQAMNALSAAAAVGFFFTAGASALAGLLAILWLWLSSPSSLAPVRTLAGLARRNLAFAPARAFSVAAIVAAATFLVVSVSSFAQRLPSDLADRTGPTGGWTDIVTFGDATGVDPTDPAVRSTLGITTDQEDLLVACDIARIRASGGSDAACTNLYATLRPTVLGVGPSFIARGGFTFTAHASLDARRGDEATNAWRLLEPPREAASAIPVILDQATAQWGLKLGGVGSRFEIADDSGQPITFEIVGLLEPGILQGFVIVAERDFEHVFPERSGYRMALVDASALPRESRGDVPRVLAAAWTDAAPTITSARRRLASLQAVQNTFLAAFQALGALGLLLGTAGVAAVQVQGTLERVGSLSVLRAVGFTLTRVRLMLVLETLSMVGVGLVIGAGAACLAVMPSLLRGEATFPLAWIAVACGGSLATAIVASTAAASRQIIPVRPRAE